jgi:hypothetical protein
MPFSTGGITDSPLAVFLKQLSKELNPIFEATMESSDFEYVDQVVTINHKQYAVARWVVNAGCTFCI